jgi:two-component system OmpR family response regulator
MCGSGADALAELPGFEPDIVLLDVMMPGMDGPDTFRAIRKLDGYENVPIIFMTAKIMEKDRDHYRALGAAGVIAKPFDPMTLSDQIREIWDQQHGG